MLPAAQPSPPPTRSIWLQRSPAGGQQGPVHPTACLSSSLCIPAAVPLLYWADAALLQLLSTCSPAQLCTLPVPAPVPRHGHGTAELHPSACSPPCSSGTAQHSAAQRGAVLSAHGDRASIGASGSWKQTLLPLQRAGASSSVPRRPAPSALPSSRGRGKTKRRTGGSACPCRGSPVPGSGVQTEARRRS